MAMDDEDLERAGTRSRKQLTSSKHFSIYLPSSDDYTPVKSRHRPRYKSKSLALISSILIFTCIIFLVSNNTQSTVKDELEQVTKFNDSTQLTDYTLLNRLLLEENIDSQKSSFQFLHPNDNNHKDSFIYQLTRHLTIGHTFDELRRLTNSISLPTMVSGTNKRVSVTAIIHATTLTQLYVQVQALLTQTALPEHIWIICDIQQKAEIEARIMTLDRRRVRIIARDNIGNDYQWIQMTAQIATEYAWIIDQDIAPGKRYLENVLKLSYSEEYRSSLLGTVGALLNPESRDNVECIPDTMHSGSKQMKSQAVDIILDNWLLHRTWIPYLLRAIKNEEKRKLFFNTTIEDAGEQSIETTTAVPYMTGLFISRTLFVTAGIPSIALPTDPIERAYWGDVRLQKTQKSETCKSLEIMIKDHNSKNMFTSLPSSIDDFYNNYYFQDMFHKQQHLAGAEETMKAGDSSVIFYVNSVQEIQQLAPILCTFEAKDDVDLHIVTSGSMNMNNKLSASDEIKNALYSLCKIDMNFPIHAIVHDLGMLQLDLANDLFYQLSRVLTAIQPKIVIHTTMEQLQSKGIKAACKLTDIPEIYLPPEEIQHTQWITDLPLDTLSKWNSFTIKLMVTTDKKNQALARLLPSITNAFYLGDQVELTIFMDQTTDRSTHSLVNEFDWKQGTKNVRHRIAKKIPKASIFVESWYPSSNDEYAIILNNELELSPFYYIWAKYAILRYRYQSEKNEKLLFGVSLYAPRILDTDPSGRRLFDPAKVLNEAGYSGKSHEPYVMQYPSHMGAVYFPEHWREFHDYITARLADKHGFDMQDITVPNLRSNEWVKSWRRYFEELIYLRSYLMLYPVQSFSTAHIELQKNSIQEQFQNATSLYDVPLVQVTSDLPLLNNFEDLPVFDIWGQLTNIDELRERGLQLHEEISACPPMTTEEVEVNHDPADLLCPFAKVVSVAVEHEDDPVPELPTREITVYL
ncbi:MAG: hypothetical protein EXX96DRAFT_580702 [Benjaminiella poitrasii]|nr:MAG: hypothetical protein EXX96DRAFT_580702 [Benjaminiella poitrasii]